MKKYIYSISLLMLPVILSAQFSSVNNGITTKIGDGVIIKYRECSLTNSNNATIENNGIIITDSDFTLNTGATYTGTGTSWLEFNGGVNQNINSDTPLFIEKLKVSNGTQLYLGNVLNVGLEFDLTNDGNVLLGPNNLVMASGATISNFDSASYFLTNNTGTLLQEVSSNNVVFPVGNSTYNPVTLNNVGTVDYYQVSVIDTVFESGTTGLVYTDDRVNRTWVIEEQTNGGSDLSVTLQWDVLDELSNFDRANCGIAYFDTCCTWNSPQTYSTAMANSIYWTQTMTNVTDLPLFTVEDMDAFLVVDNPVDKNSFDVSIFPNPIYDFVNIRIGDVDTEQLGIRIYAANGQLVYQEGFDVSGNETLQIQAARGLAVGTYMVQLLLDDGTYMTKKIIKLRD